MEMKLVGNFLYLLFDFYIFIFLYLFVMEYSMGNFGVMLGYFFSDILSFVGMMITFFCTYETRIRIAIERFKVKRE